VGKYFPLALGKREIFFWELFFSLHKNDAEFHKCIKYLKVVDGFQSVNTWNISILESKQKAANPHFQKKFQKKFQKNFKNVFFNLKKKIKNFFPPFFLYFEIPHTS
jgi:hypothetical protein